ncbi:MAG: response regulator [Chloroflexi bacterium]|nr:response regulator [Chloroflexota bacterium]
MTVPYGPLLVVEDVPHILQLLEMTLKFKGYPVVSAHNGEEALGIIARERPALVVTDILMPRLDGFALIQRLRTDPKTNTIPIIFLSATYITPEDKAFALRLGAARFLEKPVDTEELLLTIAEVLTAGPDTLPPPMRPQEFNLGYRERLEQKLRHKAAQIMRIERLLENVPSEQKAAFQALLDEARQHRREIQRELDTLYTILQESIS